MTTRRAIGFFVATTLLGWAASAGAAETLQQVLKRRGLSQQDVLAAAKTYVPTGKRDEFIAFSSGGQSGMVIVYGVPSMRLLKYIAVFNPEPWQAYGFDEESKAVLNQGRDQLAEPAADGSLADVSRLDHDSPLHLESVQ